MNMMKYRKSLLASCVGVVLGFGVSACGQSPETPQGQARSDSPREVVSDTTITTQVKARLESEVDLRDSDISVSTANGEVTLEGSVSHADARSTAEDAARSVEGVRVVHNNLEASTSRMTAGGTQQAVSDTWITTKVKSELLADSVSQGFDVNVKTKDGVVALEGTVENEQAIEHVREIVAGVEGVKRVDTSGLTVDNQS